MGFFASSPFAVVSFVATGLILFFSPPSSSVPPSSSFFIVTCQDLRSGGGSAYLVDESLDNGGYVPPTEGLLLGGASSSTEESLPCCDDCHEDFECLTHCKECLIEGASFKKKHGLQGNGYSVPNLGASSSSYYNAPYSSSSMQMRRNGVQPYPQPGPMHDNVGSRYSSRHPYPPKPYPYSPGHPRPYPRPYPRPRPYPHSRPYPNPPSSRLCCADCRNGDLFCLSHCVKHGCQPTVTCAEAGKGAYAAFCQDKCRVMSGYSFGGPEFLPDRACRGFCSKHVQEKCAMHHCEDYGCYVPECVEVAPIKCG